MPHHCIVPQCSNNSTMPKLSFHRLPLQDQNLLEKWLVNIRRANINVNSYSRVCSAHFEGGKKHGKNDVPTVFAWTKAVNSRPPPKQRPEPVVSTPRFHSIGITTNIQPDNHVSTCCKDLIIMFTADKEILVKPAATIEAGTNTLLVDTSNATTQTDHEIPVVTYSDASTMTEEDDNQSTPLRIEQIQDDQKCLHFYTGFLSFQMLMVCFNFLGTATSKLSYGDQQKLTKGKPHKLTPLNEFFLMLVRLRLGLYEQDIAYRFQVSQTTVSRICSTWINFCYCKFKELSIWPSRTIVDCNMPLSFQDLYPSTRCIIDATEIFIEKPENPSAQQLTYSSYKNHNTLKALIAIAPSGAVSFISDLFGGNISDKELTARCGLLDYLEEGDAVMADRGFNVHDLLEAKGVTLNIPPKLTDSSGGQLSESDRVKTRRIASVRIHVERAIGRIKNFRILKSVPNSMHNMANQLFFVCSILTNFQPTLVE